MSPGAQTVRFTVEPHEAALRLDQLVAARVPDVSRSRAQKLIEQGFVTVGGQPAKAAGRARPGADVSVTIPAPEPVHLVPEEMRLPVLFEDAHLLVIDKPPGVAVHPGAGISSGTVVHGILHQVSDLAGVGGELRPGIVHRLDKDTTGCLVVAKTEPALRALQAAFKGRAVDKRYLALVHGEPAAEGELDTLFGRHPVDRKRFSSRVHAGRRAVTRWRVLARGGGASLLEVALLTGRTHQIRAHFADAGHPLVADELYGGVRREKRLAPASPLRRAAEALGRQALHARTLAFAHPVTGVQVRCDAPVPADLRAALDALGIGVR